MQEQLPESDTRLSRRVELAHDSKGHEFARYSKSGGCVVTVHVLIWGDLQRVRFAVNRAARSNAGRDVAEVSSGHSSSECRRPPWMAEGRAMQEQLPERIQSEGPKKQDKTAPCRTRGSRSLRQAGSEPRRMTTVHALEQNLLEQIITHDNLTRAWKRVKANKGAAGVDAITVQDFPTWAREHWPNIKTQLLDGDYQPEAVRRVWIPKPNGDKRPLGIPCVADRVIQQAIAQVLTPIYEPLFSDHSYGFRPGRSAHQAVHKVREDLRSGNRIVVDIDLAAFFDSVNHDVLMRLLAQRVQDKRVLKLIGRYLRAGVIIEGVQHPTPLGVPQGGPLSPLLANIVLHELDVYLQQQKRSFARYADDFVICVKSTSAARRVKANVTRFLDQRLKLHINHDKSRIVPSKQLEFLGFTFRGTKIAWSDKALHRFKHRVRQLTGRSWGVSLTYRYRELRKYVVGWLNYFALSEYYRPIPELDEWLRRRMRCCYWKQWRWPRTKIKHLVSLGVGLKEAIKTGVSSKGPYAMSRTPITQRAMSNAWLAAQGLVSIKDQWVRFHYPASTA